MDTKEFTTLLTQEFIKIVKDKNTDDIPYYNGVFLEKDHTDQEILEYMELNDDGVPMDMIASYFWFRKNDAITTDKGVIRLEKAIGGDEGEGSYVQRVLSITKDDHTDYFACEGYYSSWMGIDWEGFSFTKVAPREKTIIEYLPE